VSEELVVASEVIGDSEAYASASVVVMGLGAFTVAGPVLAGQFGVASPFIYGLGLIQLLAILGDRQGSDNLLYELDWSNLILFDRQDEEARMLSEDSPIPY